MAAPTVSTMPSMPNRDLGNPFQAAAQALEAVPPPPPVEDSEGEMAFREEMKPTPKMDPGELRDILTILLEEARSTRQTGPENRDDQWRMNWDAYWARFDDSKKANWQASERLPDVSNFVERFVASLRAALTAAGEEWYRFEDPLDKDATLESIVKKVVDYGMSRCGRNSTGQEVDFVAQFAKGIKAGCMNMPAFAITWRNDRLAIDPVDAREMYYDPTGRGMYRFREYRVDRWELKKLAQQKTGTGKFLFDNEAIDRVVSSDPHEDKQEKERQTGVSQQTADNTRKPYRLQEFYGTLIDREGNLIGENQLVIMVNSDEIIRGNEDNPFWHGMDWIVSSPLIEVLGSPYGRTYVESFAQLAATFRHFTNLIMDAIHATAMPAYMAWPEKLKDAAELNNGIHPGKVFIADEDAQIGEQPIAMIDTGNISPAAFSAWEAIRGMLREAASQNEIRMGQLTGKTHVSATEIDSASAGTDSLVEHLAEDIETNLLSPILELSWITMLQHLDPAKDPWLRHELGEDVVDAIVNQRREFKNRTFRLRATGISGLLRQQRERRGIVGFLQVIAQSDLLIQALQADYSIARMVEGLMRSFGIDIQQVKKTPQEQMAPPPGAMMPGMPAGPGAPGAMAPSAPPAGIPPMTPPRA
jgi:hypothetical protein